MGARSRSTEDDGADGGGREEPGGEVEEAGGEVEDEQGEEDGEDVGEREPCVLGRGSWVHRTEKKERDAFRSVSGISSTFAVVSRTVNTTFKGFQLMHSTRSKRTERTDRCM